MSVNLDDNAPKGEDNRNQAPESGYQPRSPRGQRAGMSSWASASIAP